MVCNVYMTKGRVTGGFVLAVHGIRDKGIKALIENQTHIDLNFLTSSVVKVGLISPDLPVRFSKGAPAGYI